MLGETVAVRQATIDDLDAIAGVLARSFFDDPVTSWAYPNEKRRLERARRFFRLRTRQLLAQDQVYTTGDCAGAALWTLPNRWHETPREKVAYARLLPDVVTRLALLARGFPRIEACHPREPHFYLPLLGTDPARQGEGVGSALLAPVLALADADGLPCYLESSKESNIAFYARHGFVQRGRVDLPRGPSLWPMWRDPR